jgi:hypothetical protein
MPSDVSAGVAAVVVPTWTNVAATTQIGRVETKSGNDGKRVSRAGINRHPPTAAPLAVAHEIVRRQRRSQHPRAMKRERNRPGTIITAIVKGTVPAAPDVRFPAQSIGSPDRVLHALGRVRGRICHSSPQDRPVPRYHRPISPLFHPPDLFLLLIQLVFFRARRRGRSLCRRLIRDLDRFQLRIFLGLCLVKIVSAAWRSGPQFSRRVIGKLDRRHRRRGQNPGRIMNDWCGRRVNDRSRELERLQRHGKRRRCFMTDAAGLRRRHRHQPNHERAPENNRPAVSQSAGNRTHTYGESCSRATN